MVAELKAACSAQGMELGVSSHRIEHYWFLGEGRKFESDIHEPLERGDLYWPAVSGPDNWDDVNGDPVPTKEFLSPSILAWKIPRTEEPGGVQSIGSQRVRHD